MIARFPDQPDIRYLGAASDKEYVYSTGKLLQEFPALQARCFDYYDLEDYLLEQEVLVQDDYVSGTCAGCMYCYFRNYGQTVSFLGRINAFLRKLSNPTSTKEIV